MKKTPWFSGAVKPRRIGVYEREWQRPSRIFSFWDGHRWSMAVSARHPQGEAASNWQHQQWRGLAQDPKEGKT